MKKFFGCFALIAGLLSSCLAAAQGFDPDDWSQKHKIVIDTTADGVELKQGASQVPIALRLHTGNFNFSEAKPDGADLRVTATDGKTPLRFHLEKFDPANELAVVWVLQPKISPAAKTDAIHLHWGNAKATSQSDAKTAFDGQQSLILHFSESGSVRDASPQGNHPADFSPPRVAGPLGDAAQFDGQGAITLAGESGLKFVAANGLTVTAWVKPAASAGGTLFKQIDGRKGLALSLKSGKLFVNVNGKDLPTSAALLPDTWQHVALTVLGGKLTVYLDGESVTAVDVALEDMNGTITVGEGFRGDLDELTMASAARSADYIKTLFGSQQPDSPMLVEGESGQGESASYVRILLDAVTLDGWVVIGILAVMAVISFAVMIGKTRFLGVAKKGNSAFIRRFKEASAELLDPDSEQSAQMAQDKTLINSPIYRIYSIGLHEVAQRFRQSGRENGLSGASLDAIRASMDAGLIRENQRLNSQIVLLTIAISGGPFLGLLGTVVGVMITFAAIAAAGDVNVNAIAPGIAAALVATVAGLGVAIPALFGYNWLASQIKNVSADTQVFADEFLTRAAEQYSR